MSVRRALVSCAVLSVQDSCVFYPCCTNCFSRIDVEPRDTRRSRCSRCGYSCPRAQVEYRYRLMLMVIRDRCIFKVTVFGACLNPFFGIAANGLQRLVEDLDGPVGASTKGPLLVKAVNEFFIGRHFIFGIKVPGTVGRLSFSGPGLDKDGNRVHYVASQIILPESAGLGGCTVISFYRGLLQKATENEPESKTPSDPDTPMLLTHHLSPTSSFNNTTLFASGLVLLSPPRSQHQDSTLTPTHPWQQSLGLITSSAEQEEACTSTQDERNDQSSQRTTHHVQRSCSENLAAERHLSPHLSPDHRSSNSPSQPYRSYETSPHRGTWFSPSQPSSNRDLPGSCRTKGSPAQQQTRLSSSVVWDDLPLSESLTEFLNEKHMDFNVEMESRLQNQIETISTKDEITTSVCPNTARRTEQHSRIVQDVTNRTNNEVDGRNLNSAWNDQQDNGGGDEKFDGESYDCSVDLFGCSLMRDTHAETPPKHSETVPSKTCSLLFTPDKPELRKHTNRDSLIPPGTQELDFIPPSQSTPLVKMGLNTLKHRHNHGLTPKRRFKYQNSPLGQQHLQNLRGGFNHKRVSGLTEESEVVVPLTPASKVGWSEEQQRRNNETDPNGIVLFPQQEDGQNCPTDLIGSDSFLHQSCDWSRDLFSDSQ